MAIRAMNAAAVNGTWVLLQNCELGLGLMNEMEASVWVLVAVCCVLVSAEMILTFAWFSLDLPASARGTKAMDEETHRGDHSVRDFPLFSLFRRNVCFPTFI